MAELFQHFVQCSIFKQLTIPGIDHLELSRLMKRNIQIYRGKSIDRFISEVHSFLSLCLQQNGYH